MKLYTFPMAESILSFLARTLRQQLRKTRSMKLTLEILETRIVPTYAPAPPPPIETLIWVGTINSKWSDPKNWFELETKDAPTIMPANNSMIPVNLIFDPEYVSPTGVTVPTIVNKNSTDDIQDWAVSSLTLGKGFSGIISIDDDGIMKSTLTVNTNFTFSGGTIESAVGSHNILDFPNSTGNFTWNGGTFNDIFVSIGTVGNKPTTVSIATTSKKELENGTLILVNALASWTGGDISLPSSIFTIGNSSTLTVRTNNVIGGEFSAIYCFGNWQVPSGWTMTANVNDVVMASTAKLQLFGTLVLTNVVNVNVPTRLYELAGSINLAGGSLTSTTPVEIDGTLSGSGTITGYLVNNGWVSLSQGTITIVGEYEQTEDGVLYVTVADGARNQLVVQKTEALGLAVGLSGSFKDGFAVLAGTLIVNRTSTPIKSSNVVFLNAQNGIFDGDGFDDAIIPDNNWSDGTNNNLYFLVDINSAGIGSLDVGQGDGSVVLLPTLTSLGTTTGSGAGGTSVTLTGTNFLNAVVKFGKALLTNVIINSATSLTFITPPYAAGTVNVEVGDEAGFSAIDSTDTFAVTAPAASTVTSLGTTTGTTDGATTVSITGTNFTGAESVFFGSVGARSFTVNSSTSITAISPAQAAGTVNVTVETYGGTSAVSSNDTFAYTNASAPTVTALDNHTGTTAGGATVDITGTGFDSATGVSFGTYPVSFTIDSDTSLTVLSPPEAAGTVDVTVTSYSGTSSTSGADTFTYTAASAPTVSALSLSGGSTSGGDTVIIAGANFTGAVSVSFGGVSAPFSFLSDNAILAVSPADSAGTVDVTVSTYSGTSGTSSADHYTYSTPSLPTVTSLSSSTATTAGGTFLTITGTGFNNTYEVDFGSTPLYDFTINSDTQITLFTPAAPAGQVDVRVDTDAGTSPTTSSDTFTFIAAPAPAVTSLDNHTGTTAGGATVNITGTNFSGLTDVFFGPVEATNINFNSPTSITVNAPAEAVGTYDVTVRTMSGSSATSSSDTFAVTGSSAPVVSSLGTDSGTTKGGTLVAINGSGFTPDSVVNFGPVTALATVQSTSLITAYAPAQAAGTVDVTVTTFSGTSSTSSSDTFSYANAAGPVVSGLDVHTGTTVGGTAVTIYGSGFTSPTGVSFGGLPALWYQFNTDSSITAVAPPEAAGTIHVTVTTYSGTSSTSGADTFSFTNLTASAPTVTGVSPNTGATSGGQVVLLTGTDFYGTSAVDFNGTAATNVQVLTNTTLTATAPAGTAGTIDITVTTNNGTSSPGSADHFTYLSTAVPVITSLSPSSGTTAGNATITLTGTNFSSASAVDFGSFVAASYTVSSSTSITAVTPALPVGSYGVVVTTPSGTSAPVTFSVSAASLPTVTALGTDSATTAGGVSVSITGTNFTGVTDVFFGGVEASSITFNSATSLTVTAPRQYAGSYDVTVATYAGTSARSSADRFTYTVAAAPTVTSLGTTTGTTAGGTSVTVTGTNFTGAFDVEFGNLSAASFTVNSPTSITAISPAQYAGTVTITVWTYAGTSASSSADTFSYTNASAPTVTSLNTHSGTTAGGTSVTITGTNFSNEATVSFGSVAATSVFVNSSTSITAFAPAEASGTVHVTVTTYSGTSSTSGSDTFSYSNASTPVVSSLDVNSGPKTGGTLVTIVGSHFTGATGVSFGTTAATNFWFISDTAVEASAPRVPARWTSP